MKYLINSGRHIDMLMTFRQGQIKEMTTGES